MTTTLIACSDPEPPTVDGWHITPPTCAPAASFTITIQANRLVDPPKET